jgi:predicted sugar kinase
VVGVDSHSRHLRGRSIEGVSTAALYAAARQAGSPRSIDEVVHVSRIDELEFTRTYRYVIRELEHHRSIAGVGQSSWGPLVYGLIEADDGEIAADASRTALEACDLDGTVEVVEPRNVGAEVRVLD